MEVLSSRILLRPADPDRSRRFYRDTLRLAIYRQFGPADDPGLVLFGGQGLLEVSGRSTTAAGTVGLVEMWVAQTPTAYPWLSSRSPRTTRCDATTATAVTMQTLPFVRLWAPPAAWFAPAALG